MVSDAVILWDVITKCLTNYRYKRLALQPMNLFGVRRNKTMLEKLKNQIRKCRKGEVAVTEEIQKKEGIHLSLLLEWGD